MLAYIDPVRKGHLSVAFLLFLLLPLLYVDFHYFFGDRLFLATLGAFLFLLVAGITAVKEGASLRLTVPDLLTGLFYVSYLLSQVMADIPATGVLPLLLESSFLILYVFFRIMITRVREDDQWHVILFMVCGAATLLSLWGILQYFTGFGLSAEVKRAFSSHHLPVIAAMGNPNFLSEFIVLALPLSVAAGLRIKRFHLFWPVFALQGLCVYLTYSRLAWAVFFLFMIFSFIKAGDNRRRLGLLYGAAIVAGGLLFSFHHFSGSPQANRIVKNVTVESPFAERKTMYSAAFSMAADSSLLGHGPGAFARDFPPYRRRAEEKAGLASNKETPELKHAHSDFLEIAYDNGYVTLFLYLVMIIYALGRGAAVMKKTPEDPASSLALVPLLLLPFSLWAFPFYLPFSKMLFLLALAAAGSQEWKVSLPVLTRGVAALFIAAGLFMVFWQGRYMTSIHFYNKGIDLFDRDMAGGRVALERSVELFPWEGFAHFTLGSLLLNGGYREGIGHLEYSLDFYADGPPLLFLARAHRDFDETSASLDYYRRYLYLYPDDQAAAGEMKDVKRYHERR